MAFIVCEITEEERQRARQLQEQRTALELRDDVDERDAVRFAKEEVAFLCAIAEEYDLQENPCWGIDPYSGAIFQE